MTESNNNNLPVSQSNEDDLDIEENDSNTWTATGPMSNLPTEIYCGNSLDPAVKSKILQAEPRNKDISFAPLKMEQRMLSIMSRADKETDKNYSKLLYRASSVLRPIDNTLRMVYASKPNEEGNSLESWTQLEQTVLNSRALLLDSLSYGNDLRRELALKNLSSNYKKPTIDRGVFGDQLTELVHEENEINKLFNEAAFQKRRSQQFSKSQQFSFKPPSQGSQNNYRGNNHRGNNYRGNNYRGNNRGFYSHSQSQRNFQQNPSPASQE